jgi:FtsH-binding integral membrane protein
MTTTVSASQTETYDVGLRAFMTGVYNRMFGAIALTGILAYLASIEPLKSLFFTLNDKGQLTYTLLGIVVAFAPLGIILAQGFLKSVSGKFVLWSVSALFGLSLGSIFLKYTGGSIASTFFATAAAFGGLSLWGYTTKRNLSGWGSFLLVALIGLIVVSLINVFLLHSSGLDLIVSGAGVLIFAGFIAYDTQTTKNFYSESLSSSELGDVQDSAALNLYLDFINLFLYLLRFMGVGKSSD